MSYTRTLKSGEVRRYLTKNENGLRAERVEAHKGRTYQGYHQRRLATKRIREYIAFLYRSRLDPRDDVIYILRDLHNTQAFLRTKLIYTKQWERLGIWDDRVHASGYSHLVAKWLLDTQERIKFYEAIARELRLEVPAWATSAG